MAFVFKNKLYSLGGLDHEGYLPEPMTISDGKTTDVEVERTMKFSQGSIVVCDHDYTDYHWNIQLKEQGILFITHLKKNARFRVVEHRKVYKQQGLYSDHAIELTGVITQKKCPVRLRRIAYRDQESRKHYVFLTNLFHLSAKTIADIYKQRWKIELFFKWIK